MACKCGICSHPDRSEIENAILEMTSNGTYTLDLIGKQFEIKDQEELKMHALFHMPMVCVNEQSSTSNSELNSESTPKVDIDSLGDQFKPGAVIEDIAASTIADANSINSTNTAGRMSMAKKLKLHEADLLSSVNHEYLVTLKAMGRRINKLAQVSALEDGDEAALRIAKWMTKPMVELYLGLGAEIRKNVATLTEVDRALNGPQDGAASGLAALASAIRSSGRIDGE